MTLKEAVHLRDRLRKQLSEVEEFIRLWDVIFGDDDRETEAEQTRADAPVSIVAPAKKSESSRPKRSPTGRLAAKVAREIITERGAPMTRGELVKAFESRGYPIAGSPPSRNMGTIMWRLRDKFVNIEGHGYWPKDIPNPSLGYVPESHDRPSIFSE